MGRPDTTSQAAINERELRPVWFAYLDILGEPVRVCTLPYAVEMSGTGDAMLDGQTFSSLNAKVTSIGEVHNQEGGTETLTCTLSGLILPDLDLITIIADRANWQGRLARFWQGNLDEAGDFTGNIWDYHTGWMSALSFSGDPTHQVLQLQCETYLAMFAEARKRTYMDQKLVDPDDDSPGLATSAGSSGPRPGGGLGLPFGGGEGRLIQ